MFRHELARGYVYGRVTILGVHHCQKEAAVLEQYKIRRTVKRKKKK